MKEISAIPETTLEAFARGFFNEAGSYGFRRTDYVRFVNHLLDLTIAMKKVEINTEDAQERPNPFVKEPISAIAADNKDIFPIEGENLLIRPYSSVEDTLVFDRWLSTEAGQLFMFTHGSSCASEVKTFMEKVHDPLCVLTTKAEEPIGMVVYLEHSMQHRRAEMRMFLTDRSLLDPGIGTEAARLWINYGMVQMGLRKIVLLTLDASTRNIHFNESLGFRVEGILREEHLFNGRFRDVLRMGMTLDSTR